MQEEDTYSVEEAAKLLNRTTGRIRQMLRSGELEGYHEDGDPGRPWRIPQRVVHALREEQPSRSTETPTGSLRAPQNAAELQERVEALMRELGRLEARAELTEWAESTIREERDRLLAERDAERERAEELRRELEELRGRGFWQRLFRGRG
jgi:excisionase family DNA binding protein